jgi:hypothetical protein
MAMSEETFADVECAATLLHSLSHPGRLTILADLLTNPQSRRQARCALTVD